MDQGRTGLASGVGRERFPALSPVSVVQCRQRSGIRRCIWNRLVRNKSARPRALRLLEKPNICTPEMFREHVSFEVVDTNQIPPHFAGGFDFRGSMRFSEHLG